MQRRFVTGCVAVGAGLALALPAVAQSATRDVSAGPFLRQDQRALQRVSGELDAYFVRQVTVRRGDRVRWSLNGFHTVTFAPGGAARPPLVVPDPSTDITGVLDAAGNPFWFNGQDRLVLNPVAGARTSGTTFRPGRLQNSGLPLQEEPEPYTLKFNRKGTFGYFCVVHPGMEGRVKVVGRRQAIPSRAAVRREAVRQEKALLRRVQRASTGTGAPQGDNNIVQAGNDARNGAAVLKFFPAQATVRAGSTVTLRMSPRSTEDHTFTFGPVDYLRALAQGLIAPGPGGAVVFEARAGYPSDPPQAGVVDYTGTNHGNGFWNSGVLDRDPRSPAEPGSVRLRFTTPGTFTYICVIHPNMQGTVTVTA